MWLSTSDYAVARGYRPSSPCMTDEEREIYQHNETLMRTRVEHELSKIKREDRLNLSCWIKEENSILGDKYDIHVIIKKYNDNSAVGQGYSHKDIAPQWCKDWLDFDFTPFRRICSECDEQTNTNLDVLCEKCEQKPIYLNVPYNEKDEAKKFYARWDPDCRKWYIKNNSKYKEEVLKKWGIKK